MRDTDKALDDAIAQFPAEFGLRPFPGKLFRISRNASYISGGLFGGGAVPEHEIRLYTQVLKDGQWLDFAKGSPDELRAQVVRVGPRQTAGIEPAEANICDAMARALFVTAYADQQDEKRAAGKKHNSAGPGEDWMDVAPKTPKKAIDKAKQLCAEIERINQSPIQGLWQRAAWADDIDPDNEKMQRKFGHYVAMQALGHGVGWADDHSKLAFKVPYIEFYL